MKTEITYTKGDATKPTGNDNKVIVHVCNDIGAWGKGFVMAVSKRWTEPESQYRQWHKSKNKFELGEVQFVKVDDLLWVANLIGQHNIRKDEQGNPPIRYEAIRKGLLSVADFCIVKKASIHMPRIGCGLAGGTWDQIEPLLTETLTSAGISVTVYDF